MTEDLPQAAVPESAPERAARRWPVRLALRGLRVLGYTLLGSLLGAIGLYVYLAESRPDLKPWHLADLDAEFTASKRGQVKSFADYLELEKRLFEQLENEVYSRTQAGERQAFNRYDHGSEADPTRFATNWNRTFELARANPKAGALLLHGLSDSPYSMRACAELLHANGYYVVGLRMPGHGTAPSGLLTTQWRDIAAAVEIAVRHLDDKLGRERPLTIVGYSMGAAMAVRYSLSSLSDDKLRRPSSLVLLSPAIGISEVASLAKWASRLAWLTGLDKLAWTSILPEYDPYKYQSFTVNAGILMYDLTVEIKSQLTALGRDGTREFPRTLAFLSVADATVRAGAVVEELLDRLANDGNQLVLFDINRERELEMFLQSDPKPAIDRLFARAELGFDLTLVTNKHPGSPELVSLRRRRGSRTATSEDTELSWPRGVYSLSHVALPFRPDDPIYGAQPASGEGPQIGLLKARGEKGVIRVEASDLLRLRSNPFFSLQQQRIEEFLAK